MSPSANIPVPGSQTPATAPKPGQNAQVPGGKKPVQGGKRPVQDPKKNLGNDRISDLIKSSAKSNTKRKASKAIGVALGAVGLATSVIVPVVVYNSNKNIIISIYSQDLNTEKMELTVKKGSRVEDLHIYEVDGWEFQGYFKDAECKKPYLPEDVIKEDTSIFASYRRVFNLTVNIAGVETVLKHYADEPISATLERASLVTDRVGFIFRGFYSDAEFTNKIEDLTDFKLQDNASIWAGYARSESLRLNILDSANVQITSQTTTYYGDETILETLAREDIVGLSDEEICGWFLDSNLTQPVDSNSVLSEGVVELYTKKATLTQLSFTESENGYVASPITEKIRSGDILIVPKLYNGIEVVKVSGFEGIDVKEVVLPSSITSIEENAFKNCKLLEKINLIYVKNIGVSAFEGCTALKTITLPASLTTIQEKAFEASGLTQIHIPAGVTEIKARTFAENADLKEITFERNSVLKEIGKQAFINCSSLGLDDEGQPITITLPSNVNAIIGESAFENCTGLQNITLSTATVEISKYAFKNSGLTSILIPSTLTLMEEEAFANCASLKNVSFAEGCVLESIGASAFINCGMLGSEEGVEIILPRSLKTIDTSAFANSGLLSIEIPYSVETISASAFANCVDLNNLTFEKAPVLRKSSTKRSVQIQKIISENAFAGCRSLASVEFTKEIASIGNNAFENCSILTTITFEGNSTLSSIGDSAFRGAAVTSFIVPSSLTSMGTRVFESLNGQTHTLTVKFESGSVLETIGDNAFEYSRIKSIDFKNSAISRIESSAFANCTMLDTVKLTETLISIDTHAFENCSALVSITLPDSLETIGEFSFANSGLASLKIAKGLTSIGASAFENNASLTTLAFSNDGVLSTVGSKAFVGTSINEIKLPVSLTNIEDSAFAIESLSVVDFETNSEITILRTEQFTYGNVVSGISKFKIPENVSDLSLFKFNTFASTLTDVTFTEGEITKVDDNLFEDCYNLKNVKISTKIETIGNYSFANTALKKLDKNNIPVTIHDTNTIVDDKDVFVPAIGIGAFKGCVQLESVTLPATISSIADETFEGCTVLGAITLPASVTKIGVSAFKNSALKSITMPAGITEIGDFAFEGCSELGGIKSESSQERYKIILSASLERIGKNAFANTAIKEIKIPSTVKTIGEYAFANNSLAIVDIGAESALTEFKESWFINGDVVAPIESIEIPEKVTDISTETFINFKNSLKIVNFASNSLVTEIDAEMFKGFEALQSVTLPYGVTEIKAGAFENATSLSEIKLSADLRLIGNNAFKGTALENISIPSKVEVIGEYAFNTELKNVEFEGNRLTTLGRGAFLETKISEINLPISLSSLGGEVFKNCTELSKIDFGSNENITDLGENNFEGCISLTEFEVPLAVTNIGTSTFAGCENLSELTFHPYSVLESIEDSAFLGSNITSVTLPAKLKTIGVAAFNKLTRLDFVSNCELEELNNNSFTGSELSYVKIPENVVDLTNFDLHEYATSLTEIEFAANNNIQVINENEFENLYVLEKVTLSNKLQHIGTRAFAGCIKLSSVAMKYNLKTIGTLAFNGCSSLNDIYIPQNVESIGIAAFENSALTSLVFDSNCELERIEERAFKNTSITAVTLPTTVEYIGDYAFNSGDKAGITEIVLPRTLTTIGEQAFNKLIKLDFEANSLITEFNSDSFYDCSLEYIKIPELVNDLSNFNFQYYADTLTTVEFAENSIMETLGSVDSVDVGMFENCARLTEVKLPKVLKTIGVNTFLNSGLTQVMLPETLTEIGAHAFEGTALTEITIPKYVTSIGAYAFNELSTLSGIVFNKDYQLGLSIGDYAFAKTSITHLDLSSNFINVGNHAFEESSIENLILSDYVCVGDYAFKGCTGLTQINVEQIVGEGAFEDCINLSYLTLYGPLSEIGARAFKNCPISLVVIPSTVTTIGEEAFTNLCDLYFEENSNMVNGAILSTSFTGSKLETISFSNGISDITNFNFAEFKDTLRSVRMATETESSGVTAIADETFKDFANLLEVVLPTELQTIGANAFEGTALTEITLPGKVTSIGDYAFNELSTLAEVDFDSNRTETLSIGAYAFARTNIESLVLDEKIQTGTSSFAYCENLKSLDVAGNIGMASFASNYLDQVVLHDTITEIGLDAFEASGVLDLVWLGDSSKYFELYLGSKYSMPEGVRFGETIEDATELTSISIPVNIVDDTEENEYSNQDETKETTPFSFYKINYMESLERVGFGSYDGKVTKLHDNMFSSTAPIKEFVFSNGIMDISDFNFRTYKDTLQLVEMSESRITELKSNEVIGTNLENGENVYAGVFEGCSNLEAVNLPIGLQYIYNSAFYGTNLTAINESLDLDLSSFTELKEIGYNAFRGTKKTSVSLPESIQTIGDRAFSNCLELTTVNIPKASPVWDEEYSYEEPLPQGIYIFSGCSKLETATISTYAMGASAFENCENLKTVTLQENGDIPEYAFSGCTALSKVDNTQGKYISSYAFNGCVGLNSNSFRTTLRAIDEITRVGNSNKVTYKDVEINYGMISPAGIGEYAFKDCTSLGLNSTGVYNQQFIISTKDAKSINFIENYAFDGCTKLTDVWLAVLYTGERFEFDDYDNSYTMYFEEKSNTSWQLKSGAFAGSALTNLDFAAIQGGAYIYGGFSHNWISDPIVYSFSEAYTNAANYRSYGIFEYWHAGINGGRYEDYDKNNFFTPYQNKLYSIFINNENILETGAGESGYIFYPRTVDLAEMMKDVTANKTLDVKNVATWKVLSDSKAQYVYAFGSHSDYSYDHYD